MNEIVKEFTSYFKKPIHLLTIEDQLIYYKLIAILEGHIVAFSDEEIGKINIRLFYDYKHKDFLRPVDVIVAGDYPKTLKHIISKCKINEDEIVKLKKISKEYKREKCFKFLETQSV